jgi:hemolysin III
MTSPIGAAAQLGAQLPSLVRLKPRMRGWLHAYAAVISLASGAALVIAATALRGLSAGVSTSLYALTVTLLFSVSATYHRIAWGPRGSAVMRRLDHSMIFVFIAGTYTALAVNALPRGDATAVLVVVWCGAAAGVALKLAWPHAPAWVGVPCYVGLGWVAAFVFPQLLHTAGVAAFVLLVIGGVAYTVGGVVYGLKRPDPFPATFGYHEVFHAATIVGALSQYIAIWLALF